MTTTEQATTPTVADEREQASAALTAAIVQMAKAIGSENTARVLGGVASALKSGLDALAAADISTKH